MPESNLLSYANAIGPRSRVSARDGGVNVIRSDIEDTKAGVAPEIWAKSLALMSIKRYRAGEHDSRLARHAVILGQVTRSGRAKLP